MGNDLQFACKFQLHADNVEQQLKQVKIEYGVNWKWIDYAKLRYARSREKVILRRGDHVSS